jgi:hypothetical protein
MMRSDGALSLALLGGGFILWSSAFVALYAIFSIGCHFGWEQVELGPMSLLRWILVALWAAHLVAHAAALVWIRGRFVSFDTAQRAKWRYLFRLGVAVHFAAGMSTGFLAVPIMGASVCI